MLWFKCNCCLDCTPNGFYNPEIMMCLHNVVAGKSASSVSTCDEQYTISVVTEEKRNEMGVVSGALETVLSA